MTIKCVVPISGGKDSQTCLELALLKFSPDEILGVFCDTKFEHPKTYSHIDKMRQLYNVQIVVLNNGDVFSKVRHYGRFPSDNVRFCTDELKIRIGKQFYSMLARLQGCGFEIWYGMRLGESFARSERYKNIKPNDLYPPNFVMGSKYPKYLEKQGVMFRLPVLSWEDEDIYDYLGDKINPLYADGVDRVGCFPCLASGDKPKEFAFQLDDFGRQRRIDVLNLGFEIGKNIFTTKGGRKRNPDADPMNLLDIQERSISDDLAPCFHCNI